MLILHFVLVPPIYSQLDWSKTKIRNDFIIWANVVSIECQADYDYYNKITIICIASHCFDLVCSDDQAVVRRHVTFGNWDEPGSE